MRSLAIITLVFLAACNKDSSPEGRFKMRTEQLEARLDSLANQNKAILDSIGVINQKLKELKNK
jgi:mevalonate kinase